MNFLDDFKNKYPAPIVVFSQLHPDKDDSKEFEERVKGYKGILVPVTCALEIKPNKIALTTEWILHKSRWQSEHRVSESRGVSTGWLKGKFTSLEDKEYVEFKQKRQQRALERINEGERKNVANLSRE